jgi:glucose-fructose oxidoreductase
MQTYHRRRLVVTPFAVKEGGMKPEAVAAPLNRRNFLQRAAVAATGLAVLPRAWSQANGAGRRKLGVALCGLGRYSTGQLGPALRQTQFCELRGVVTGDPDKGRRWAREYGFPESSVYGYDTIDRMAENPDIDILYSVTPPALHKRDALRAFAAGKHVISEKPMALNVAECDEMIAAAKSAGKQLTIGYRTQFHPYYQRLKELVRQGDYGVFQRMSGGFGSGGPQLGTWRMRRAMGGGPLMDMGVYVLYASAMAKREEAPVAVTAREPAKTRPDDFSDIEETMYFTLEYADGSTCEGETSWVQPSNRFRAEGAGGWFETNPAYSYGGLRGRTSDGPLPSEAGFNQQAHQMDHDAQAILDGTPSIIPGELGRRDIAVIAAIFEAARTGQRVEVRA